MPRSKVLPPTRVVAVNLLIHQLEALDKIASARGLSRSEAVREAIDRYLQEESVKLGIKVALESHPKPSVKKSARAILMQKKLAKLRREVGELEGQVGELEAYVNALERINSKYVYDGGGWVGKDVILKRCRERLKSLQKWLRSLENLCLRLEQMGHDVVEDAERLLAIEERIDALWERV